MGFSDERRGKMLEIVSIKLRSEEVRYFQVKDLDLQIGDKVIVETGDGKEIGEVKKKLKENYINKEYFNISWVDRIATEEDLKKITDLENKEKEVFNIAKEKIEQHKLLMNLINVHSMFDESKITFNFTADHRIDFRDLVKELASIFNTRIELHQIGPRDEAKQTCSIGPCGLPLCCNKFLKEFEPLSVQMAKEQGLPLNPSRISGVCGRLLCCLKYEYDMYMEVKQKLPPLGSKVLIEDVEGIIVEVNVPKETLIVELPEGGKVEIKAQEAIVTKKISDEEGG